jgi:hypothetical protein
LKNLILRSERKRASRRIGRRWRVFQLTCQTKASRMKRSAMRDVRVMHPLASSRLTRGPMGPPLRPFGASHGCSGRARARQYERRRVTQTSRNAGSGGCLVPDFAEVPPLTVIAGLDPAIQATRLSAWGPGCPERQPARGTSPTCHPPASRRRDRGIQ